MARPSAGVGLNQQIGDHRWPIKCPHKHHAHAYERLAKTHTADFMPPQRLQWTAGQMYLVKCTSTRAMSVEGLPNTHTIVTQSIMTLGVSQECRKHAMHARLEYHVAIAAPAVFNCSKSARLYGTARNELLTNHSIRGSGKGDNGPSSGTRT